MTPMGGKLKLPLIDRAMKKFIVSLPEEVPRAMQKLDSDFGYNDSVVILLKEIIDEYIKSLWERGYLEDSNIVSHVQSIDLPEEIMMQLHVGTKVSKMLIQKIATDDELIDSLAEYCYRFCDKLKDKGFTTEQAIDILAGIKLPGGKG